MTAVGAAAADAAAHERRPGRPRSVAADQAILAAGLVELADVGVDAVAIESIASRAGVARTTVYRRWDNRDALLLDAVTSLEAEPVWRAAGVSVRDDLVAMLEVIRNGSGHRLHERLFPRLIAAAHSHPELLRRYDRIVLEPRREHLREVLQRGIATGELRPDVDVEAALHAVVFPMLYALSMRTDVTPVAPDFAVRTVDLLLQGMAA